MNFQGKPFRLKLVRPTPNRNIEDETKEEKKVNEEVAISCGENNFSPPVMGKQVQLHTREKLTQEQIATI